MTDKEFYETPFEELSFVKSIKEDKSKAHLITSNGEEVTEADKGRLMGELFVKNQELKKEIDKLDEMCFSQKKEIENLKKELYQERTHQNNLSNIREKQRDAQWEKEILALKERQCFGKVYFGDGLCYSPKDGSITCKDITEILERMKR